MGYFDWVDQFLAENPGYVELSDRMILVPLKSNTESMEFPGSLNRWDRYHIIPQLAGTIPLIYHLYIAYWVIIYHRSHPLREQIETAIDWGSEVEGGWWLLKRESVVFFRIFSQHFRLNFLVHPWNLTWFTWKEVPRKGDSELGNHHFSASMLNFVRGSIVLIKIVWSTFFVWKQLAAFHWEQLVHTVIFCSRPGQRIRHVFFFFFNGWISWRNTPLKINMEHNHGGLEDHFPF